MPEHTTRCMSHYFRPYWNNKQQRQQISSSSHAKHFNIRCLPMDRLCK